MKLGINMPFVRADGDVLTAKDIMSRARAIENAGFDGIWIGDAIGRMRLTRPDPLRLVSPAIRMSGRGNRLQRTASEIEGRHERERRHAASGTN